MIELKPATTKADYECISKLAHTIWHEHYIKIISLEQIEYMLEKFNSVKSIEERVQVGVKFYCLTWMIMLWRKRYSFQSSVFSLQ